MTVEESVIEHAKKRKHKVCPIMTAGLYSNPNITVKMLATETHVIRCIKEDCMAYINDTCTFSREGS